MKKILTHCEEIRQYPGMSFFTEFISVRRVLLWKAGDRRSRNYGRITGTPTSGHDRPSVVSCRIRGISWWWGIRPSGNRSYRRNNRMYFQSFRYSFIRFLLTQFLQGNLGGNFTGDEHRTESRSHPGQSVDSAHGHAGHD